MMVDLNLYERIKTLKAEHGMGTLQALRCARMYTNIDHILQYLREAIGHQEFLSEKFVTEAVIVVEGVLGKDPLKILHSDPTFAQKYKGLFIDYSKEYLLQSNEDELDKKIVAMEKSFENAGLKPGGDGIEDEFCAEYEWRDYLFFEAYNTDDFFEPPNELFLSRYDRAVLESNLNKEEIQKDIALDYVREAPGLDASLTAPQRLAWIEHKLRGILGRSRVVGYGSENFSSGVISFEAIVMTQVLGNPMVNPPPGWIISDPRKKATEIIYSLMHGNKSGKERAELERQYAGQRAKYLLTAIEENNDWLLKMLD